MSEIAANNLKERGNSCLKDKEYDRAEAFYGEAINLTPDNSKLYSNRCTARLLLHNYEGALTDAKKCASLDPDWYKGYVQMGSCFMELQKYADALAQYKKALPLADNRTAIEDLMNKATEKISQHNLKYHLFGNAIKSLNTLENIIRIIMFICAIFVFIPFGKLRYKAIGIFSMSYLCLLIIHIYKTYGLPRFQMNYFLQLKRDNLVIYAIPYFLFIKTPSIVMVMNIILIHEAVSCVLFVYDILVMKFPDSAKKSVAILNQVMDKAMQNTEWKNSTSEQKKYITNEIVGMAGASFEIVLLPASFLGLRNGFRGITNILLIAQYVMFRFSSDSYVAV